MAGERPGRFPRQKGVAWAATGAALAWWTGALVLWGQRPIGTGGYLLLCVGFAVGTYVWARLRREPLSTGDSLWFGWAAFNLWPLFLVAYLGGTLWSVVCWLWKQLGGLWPGE
jgi:hypothetical protein